MWQIAIAQKVSSCGLSDALERGYELLHWNEKPEQAKNPDEKIGRGVIIIQQGSGLPGIDSANARLVMNEDGTFHLLIGGTDLGTGLDTMAVKLVAECLQTNVSEITITATDTDNTSFDVGAYASSGTYFTGSAVLNTAKEMKKILLKEASKHLNEPEEDLDVIYPHR